MKNQQQINQARNNAWCVYSRDEVDTAVSKMALDINATLADSNPLVICIMNGGLVLTGQLMPLLNFPLQLDYLHATRYQGATEGGELCWLNKPQNSLQGRTILLVDDIFEQGTTLAKIIDYCKEQGAAAVYCAVLLKKKLAHRQYDINIDFMGLEVEDHYVFGFGMDLYHYWRNADGIYAIKEDTQ